MSYIAPTVEQFLTSYPQFADASEQNITDALAAAGRNVDTTWFEDDYQPAYMLYAAHILTVDELALDSGGSGARIVSESLGPISVNYERNASAYDADVLGSTSYGQRYVRLLQLNRGGPRIV
jgi:hypothetical protein